MKCTSLSSIQGAKQATTSIASPENRLPTACMPDPGEPTSEMASVKMMTTTSLEKTIARVNSTHRRTHPDVARAAAPENATGANTAATMIIALRMTNIAHTKNDAIR